MHAALHVDGAQGCFECTLELHEERVSDGLDLVSPMPGEDRAKESPMVLQEFQCCRLVLLRKTRISYDVGEHYCRQSAFPLGQAVGAV